MSTFPWLTVLGAVPLVGAVVVWLLPSGVAARAKQVALGFSLLTLVAGILATVAYAGSPTTTQFRLAEQHQWIPQFGVSYALGVDGIALALILMSLILTPICLLAAWRDLPSTDGAPNPREKGYFALMLVLETFMVGVFAATDVFLFYVFFEAMLIPVYFLIGQYGGPRRQYAAVKFLVFSLVGGLIMLAAVIGLYTQGPGGADGFLVEKLTGLNLDPTTGRLLFLGFFFAFAVKAPMVPVHTWLPDAATEARPATATLLVGVLDKVGTYGMIRFCLQLFPEASQWATPVVIALAVISVLYGALLAIGQTDIMRLIAYTSVSHFGFIVLGIFAMTSTGFAGSTLYMVNHGFTTAALFLIAAMMVSRRGSKRISDFGGWQRVTPLLAGTFLVAGLSGLALPGLGAFVAEFLTLVGTFQRYPVPAVIATIGIILAALYILLMYKRMATGPVPESAAGTRDLGAREKWVVAPLIALFLVLGFYPKPALDMINPAVSTTLGYMGVVDPAPIVPVNAQGGHAVTALVPAQFVAASLNYAALLPLLIVFGFAMIGVLVEAFVPRSSRYPVQVAITLIGLVGAFLSVVLVAVNNQTSTAGLASGTSVKGSVVIDGPALFLQGAVLVLSFMGVLTMAERLGGVGSDAFTPMGAATPGSPQEAQAVRAGLATSEVFPLTLFSVGGMMLFPAAGDLITMFVALEVLSLPLYILVGLARRRRLLSQEASLKYFLLGSFSSAFFLFGTSLLFGYSGSVYLSDIAEAITNGQSTMNGLLVPGVLLVAVGLLFKIGAAPFHAWVPDAYEGAPTPVTGWMAAATKLAAFGAILRVVYVGIVGDRWDWAPAVVAVAILTMVVGAVLSVTQTDIKRMLAYSSIAHAGFILVGVLAFDKAGVSGVMFYLVCYGLMTIAAFGIVNLVRDRGNQSEATRLTQWAGLGRRHPLTAAIFAFLLLAFAGIPLTSGFTAKFAVFEPALRSGGAGTLLVVIGLLCSAITVFVYVRVIVLMYFSDPQGDSVGVVTPSALTQVAIGAGALLTLVLGVAPSSLLLLAGNASQFIR